MTKATDRETLQKLIGEKVKERRIELGHNKVQLAKLVGITHAAISRFESGARLPSPQVLFKIAEVLKVTPNYLMGKKENLDIGDLSLEEKLLLQVYRETSPENQETIQKIIKSLYREGKLKIEATSSAKAKGVVKPPTPPGVKKKRIRANKSP